MNKWSLPKELVHQSSTCLANHVSGYIKCTSFGSDCIMHGFAVYSGEIDSVPEPDRVPTLYCTLLCAFLSVAFGQGECVPLYKKFFNQPNQLLLLLSCKLLTWMCGPPHACTPGWIVPAFGVNCATLGWIGPFKFYGVFFVFTVLDHRINHLLGF